MWKYLLPLLGISVAIAFNNCSPSAEFDSQSEFYSKVSDGESVEIVSEEELGDLVHNDTPDSGDNMDTQDPTDKGDMGFEDEPEEEEEIKRPGKRGKDRMAQQTTKERLMEQIKNGNKDRMVISVRELTENPDIIEAASCEKGNGKGPQRVWVCHQADGDPSKQKPLCLPIFAADSQIKNGTSLLGYCERGENAGRGHAGKFGAPE